MCLNSRNSPNWVGIRNTSNYSPFDVELDGDLPPIIKSIRNYIFSVVKKDLISISKNPLLKMNLPSKHSPCVGIRTCSDYSPFGVELDGRTVSGGYRYGFQNQEKDDEIKGEGNSVNYMFRMHDSRIGRFFAIDPMADKYPQNSPYTFSENVVINSIELEGLEKKLAIAMSGGESTHYSSSDINAFDARATKLKSAGFEKYNGVNNGDELVQILVDASKIEPISTVITFAHSGAPGIFMDDDQGYYTANWNDFKGQYKESEVSSTAANVQDVKEAMGRGEIKFTENAVWIFASCYTANKDDARLDEPARHIAYSTAYRLGVTSIGSTGSVYPEIVDGKETGKLKTDGVFKMYKWNAEKETMEVKELGRTIDPIDYSPKE